ncbi:hypothetical protein Clacol_000883 [Clathrus columnatus]|uniref:Uncharacterized protein n=1 Tax=Clathrus columnatus TaxID=1419009 RepID=A0AAV5A219_9AGAM|nr:hypothetical protein Clacol_000883 [Clathrus columnatus]
MPSSFLPKLSSHVATSRQLPQHPKMRLSYILNPSPPTQSTVVPAPVPLPAEALLDSPSSHDSSNQHVPSEKPSSSRSSSSLLSQAEDLMPTFRPDFSESENLLPYCLSSHLPPRHHVSTSPEVPSIASSVSEPSSNSLPSPVSCNSIPGHYNYHESSNAFPKSSVMNQAWDESTSLGDPRPICPLSRCSSPLLKIPPNTPVVSPQSCKTNVPPSSPTVIRQPVPQHPKMRLSYILNPPSPTTIRPELADPPYADSRSPSPTRSEYCLSSLSDSPVKRSTVITLQTPDDGSPLASPVTTWRSSLLPISTIVPDLPLIMVEPPQLLPWEGPPSQGLNSRNHRAYPRAGVHWMLIFGSDIE